MSRSLSRRLLGILFAAILTAWLATAFFSYRDARQKIDEVLDANLVQAAALMMTLLPRADAAAAPVTGPPEAAGGVAFRVVDGAGRTILRSPHFPDLPTDIGIGGFADATRDDTRWRIHGIRDEATGSVVQVAEAYEPRIELAGSVASHLLHPVWIALPLLAALIWFAVRWGLAPLRSLAQELQLRDPGKLEALGDDVPQETRPLVQALNALFARVTALQERERRFAADAAHELRTPLAAIRTHAEVAQAARTEDERRRAIDNVLRGTERAAHLVEQLLVLARLEPQGVSPSVARVALRAVAARAVADCAPLAAAGKVDLGLSDAGGAEAVVDGNADLLTIMARNLVDNAVRYAGAGATVDVSVAQAANGVRFVVADDGPGLPPGERERIFDRFYRSLGTRQEGSGLGLSIVARIAELHGARIELDAGIGGRGLKVTVTFPAGRLHPREGI